MTKMTKSVLNDNYSIAIQYKKKNFFLVLSILSCIIFAPYLNVQEDIGGKLTREG